MRSAKAKTGLLVRVFIFVFFFVVTFVVVTFLVCLIHVAAVDFDVVAIVSHSRTIVGDEEGMLEARGFPLGLQTRHETVESLNIVEGPATALIVVSLELGQIEVLVERL